MHTMTIPRYTATDEQVEDIRCESLARYGIPYAEAVQNLEETAAAGAAKLPSEPPVPAYELVTI